MGVKLQRPGEPGHPGGNRRIYVRVNHRGQRKTRVFNTTKGAEAYAAQVEAYLKLGKAADVFAGPTPAAEPVSVPTFADAVALWERLDAPAFKAGTLDTYRNILTKHLVPAFGGRRLADLALADIEAWWLPKLAAGLSRKHLANCRRVLTAVVRRALRSKLLHEDLTLSIQGPLPQATGDAPQADWLAPGELRAVLHRARTLAARHYPILLTMATCGLRFGEALGLQVGDVDVAGRRLAIRRAIRKHVVATPKTGRARTIALPASTTAALADWLETVRAEAALRGREPLWLFPGATGQPIDDEAVRRAFTRCLGAAGIRRRVRLHDLQHTVASLAIQAGTPVEVVSRFLGHATVSTTWDTYFHLAPGATQAAADALERIVNPAPAEGQIRNPRATDGPAPAGEAANLAEFSDGFE